MARSYFVVDGALTTDLAVVLNIEQLKPDSNSYGMSPIFEHLICTHGVCRDCGVKSSTLYPHSFCRGKTPGVGYLWFVLPIEEEAGFHAEFSRERDRIRTFKRKHREIKALGSHTSAQLIALLAAQERRCYYCFASLVSPAGREYFHRDHIESLRRGRTNWITNIVLACKPCNSQKATGSALAFMRRKRATLTESTLRDLQRIRKQVARWKSTQSKAEG